MLLTVVTIITSFATAAITLALALRDEKADKSTKRLAWLACVVAVSASVATTWAAIEEAQAQDHLLASITGGSAYPQLAFSHTQDPIERMEMSVENSGDYPLFDVAALVCDLLKGDEMLPPDNRGDYCVGVSVGTVLPGTSQAIHSVALASRTKLAFTVMLFARNGVVWGDARALKMNGNWEYAWRIMEDRVPPVVLKQTRTPRYPANADDDLDWEGTSSGSMDSETRR